MVERPTPFILSKSERKLIKTVIDIAEKDPKRTILGFVQMCERNETVYRNKDLGIVIKCFKFILEENTTESVRVPTIELGNEWVAQPLVIKKDTALAVKILRKELAGFHCDLHHLNVGWYRENGVLVPKMFDW